jgi:glycosyltransferase involved in cell wall biosynthesis
MKDHPTFFKAAALLVQEHRNVRFMCIGDGSVDYKLELQSLSKELRLKDRLIWAGTRNDMPAVYNAFDIATSSSSYGEGFPNVIGEAMACGVPCVVTDVGDSALITDDIGIVVPPNNPEALKSGWKQLLEKDRSEIALRGRVRIVENFSVKQLIRQTEKVIWPKA